MTLYRVEKGKNRKSHRAMSARSAYFTHAKPIHLYFIVLRCWNTWLIFSDVIAHIHRWPATGQNSRRIRKFTLRVLSSNCRSARRMQATPCSNCQTHSAISAAAGLFRHAVCLFRFCDIHFGKKNYTKHTTTHAEKYKLFIFVLSEFESVRRGPATAYEYLHLYAFFEMKYLFIFGEY